MVDFFSVPAVPTSLYHYFLHFCAACTCILPSLWHSSLQRGTASRIGPGQEDFGMLQHLLCLCLHAGPLLLAAWRLHCCWADVGTWDAWYFRTVSRQHLAYLSLISSTTLAWGRKEETPARRTKRGLPALPLPPHAAGVAAGTDTPLRTPRYLPSLVHACWACCYCERTFVLLFPRGDVGWRQWTFEHGGLGMRYSCCLFALRKTLGAKRLPSRGNFAPGRCYKTQYRSAR